MNKSITKTEIVFPFVILFIFIASSAGMWFYTKNGFFFFDLPYIGFSIFLGMMLNTFLPLRHKGWGRRITQLLVGFYFLYFLGFVLKVNMQIEGFFFFIFMGIFSGPTLHYSIAKIFGPLVFGRGFCGWACWTAMVLDFLPWKKTSIRKRYFGIFRYIHFLLSLSLTFILFFILKASPGDYTITALYWFVTGNLLYYAIAVTIAVILKDNRAFCKYVCPIPTLQKITSRFAVFKLKVDNGRCNQCGVCEKSCPMNIKILDYAKKNKRILSTECILCTTCTGVCPKKAVHITAGFDAGIKEKLSIE